jgi:hypothetical protein
MLGGSMLVAMAGFFALVALARPLLVLWLGPALAAPVAPLVPVFALAYFFLALSPAPFHLVNGIGRRVQHENQGFMKIGGEQDAMGANFKADVRIAGIKPIDDPQLLGNFQLPSRIRYYKPLKGPNGFEVYPAASGPSR